MGIFTGVLSKVGGKIPALAAYKWYFLGGIAVVFLTIIGMQSLRLHNMEQNLIEKEAELQTTRVLVLKQRDIIQSQAVAIDEVVVLLENCQRLNDRIKVDSQRAVNELQHELASVSETVQKQKNTVKEALKDETCTNISIPGDVSSVLRARAASANTEG